MLAKLDKLLGQADLLASEGSICFAEGQLEAGFTKVIRLQCEVQISLK